MAIVEWSNKFYARAFAWAANGMGDGEIAKSLGVTVKRFTRWVNEDEALREGLEEARRPKTGYADFKAFIYEKLPRKVKALWDELDSIRRLPVQDGTKKPRRQAIMNLIDESPVRFQQALFLHALIKCNFIVGMACLETGISTYVVRGWRQEDTKFDKLIEGINEFKGDFFESCLVDQCRQGDSAAIIFANKTHNKTRGYGLDHTIKVETETVHKHEVSVEDLPTDAKRAVLEAIRAKKQLQLEDNRDVVDAEVVE